MKRIGILAALAAALASSGAYAADVFGRDSLKDSGSTVVSSSPWQGPYVAIGGGYRWHNWESVKRCLADLLAGEPKDEPADFGGRVTRLAPVPGAGSTVGQGLAATPRGAGRGPRSDT